MHNLKYKIVIGILSVSLIGTISSLMGQMIRAGKERQDMHNKQYDRRVVDILKQSCEHRGGVRSFRLHENSVEAECDYKSPGIRSVSEIYVYGVDSVVEGHK